MNFDYILLYLTAVFVNTAYVLGYNKLKKINNEVQFNYKNILILLFVAAFIVYNSIYNTGFVKPVICFIFLIALVYYFFKDKLNILLSYGITIYFLVSFTEIVLSILLITTKISSYEIFENNAVVKSIFSVLTLTISYNLCKFNFFKTIAEKLSIFMNKSKLSVIIFIAILILPMSLQFKYLNNVNTITYIMNIILFIIFGIIISVLLYYEIKTNNEIQKYENLLSFISKYEKIIDEQRIGRHEIHNNLLILKSFKNKNSKEFNEILDDFILLYSKSENTIKNMYKLPNGIKGIVYYKLMNINKNSINVNINISKQIKIKLYKTDNKEYISLCKILSIILDNAIEAAKESNNKLLNIDIFMESKKIVFIICNSYNSKKLNFSKINETRYSTKGKNRGYGLSIANKLSKSSKYINFDQYIDNNLFITRLEVDN